MQDHQKAGERRSEKGDSVEEKKKRRHYSPEETSAIEDWFREFIEEGKHPVIGDCKDFLNTTDVTVGRSPRDIRDKVINLIKYK